MENFNIGMAIFVTVIGIWSIKKAFSGGFSLSSFGGIMVSSSNDEISLKGKILSVVYNKEVLFGDPEAKAVNSNTISQSQDNCQLVIKGGHVTVKGNLNSLKVNGKKVL